MENSIIDLIIRVKTDIWQKGDYRIHSKYKEAVLKSWLI
jgi:hypothetical protein